jgi:hypothetical protein
MNEVPKEESPTLIGLLPATEEGTIIVGASLDSASTSFVSRCTGPRDFARFVVGSLFFRELLCFFKVDLLSCFDCTLECVDHW